MKNNLTAEELNFITDMALNALWTRCHEKLKENLGDLENRNIESTKKECERIMHKIDPNLF